MPSTAPAARPLPLHRMAVAGLLLVVGGVAAGAPGTPAAGQTGAELYRTACASCHGAYGRGAPAGLANLAVPVPDFTDCSFASREPAADWAAIAHEGGPVRGFSELMPAFGGVLTMAQLEAVVAYVKSLCGDRAWPPGEFNLPKALLTGKAFPEDETMVLLTVDAEGDHSIAAKVIHEKRFGARNQWEVVVPFAWWEAPEANGDSGWTSGVGDLAVAVKRAVYHDLARGAIVAVAGELILPTGDDDRGNGAGTVEIEPFLTYGQILPADCFFQSQLGGVVPVDRDHHDKALLRLNLGRTFTSGRFGRSWSPMVDLAAARALTADASTEWDVVPQLQVTLNARQHIRVNLGVRLPVDDDDQRDTKVMLYFLWDWFDGGLLEGW